MRLPHSCARELQQLLPWIHLPFFFSLHCSCFLHREVALDVAYSHIQMFISKSQIQVPLSRFESAAISLEFKCCSCVGLYWACCPSSSMECWWSEAHILENSPLGWHRGLAWHLSVSPFVQHRNTFPLYATFWTFWSSSALKKNKEIALCEPESSITQVGYRVQLKKSCGPACQTSPPQWYQSHNWDCILQTVQFEWIGVNHVDTILHSKQNAIRNVRYCVVPDIIPDIVTDTTTNIAYYVNIGYQHTRSSTIKCFVWGTFGSLFHKLCPGMLNS